MMQGQQPTRLKKEPLVSVIFEIRFQAALPVASILPGALYHQLGCSAIAKLPQSEIPQTLRDNEPDLKYVPLIQLSWGQYQISIGDRSIVLSCQMPYPGWTTFKRSIIELLDKSKETSLLGPIERYSLKYSDIIETPDEGLHPEDLITIRSTIGDENIDLRKTTIRTEAANNGKICIFQFIGNATATQANGKITTGIYLDIDTIYNIEPAPLSEILTTFEEKIEELHADNKNLFFKCISDEGVKYLDPEYA